MSDASTAPGVPQPAPLYRELERSMRDALASGEWKPGTAIPAERRLAERHGVSIGTVRKAIDALVDANLLIRQQGRGTFVATHTRDRLMYYFFHVVPEVGPKAYPDVRTVAFARGKADRVESEKLLVPPGEAVIRIRNLLHLGAEPVIVDDIAIAAARFPGLTEKQFRERPSTIYHLYQDAFGITVARSSERLRAGVADADCADLLGVARGTAVLVVRRVALGLSGEPVEWRVSRVNTAKHEYYAELG